MRPAKTLLKTSAMSPNLSNHSRSLHHCLFTKFLSPSLGKKKIWGGKMLTQMSKRSGRVRQFWQRAADGWIQKHRPRIQRSQIQALCLGSVACLLKCGDFSENDLQALTDVSVCAEQSLENPGANRLVYHRNYRVSWAQPLVMPVLFSVLYYGFTWRWMMVCSISRVFSLVFNFFLMIIITVVTQGTVE